MTSWIVVVGEGFEENWDRAVDFQLWDLKKRRGIKRGDDVFFWQAPNKGFRGWARAVSDSTDGTPDPRPWIAKDKTEYVQRFYFQLMSDLSLSGKWGAFFANTTITAGPNTAPVAVTNPGDEAYLRELFLQRVDQSTILPGLAVEIDKGVPFLSEEDHRRLRNQIVAVREGQPRFRASLIDAYGGRCAVSGTAVVRVLEAAHISPYRGAHSNTVTNGLLLRSDIHTLFDAKHLAITPQLRIEVDPALEETPYWGFRGRDIRLPSKNSQFPDSNALQQHYASCHWTSPAT